MENNPEIPEIRPDLQQLFMNVINEEYSAFFVCKEEMTAGVFEQAASESEVGRAELLDLIAREAVDNKIYGQARPFLHGSLAFVKGIYPDVLDVNRYPVGTNDTHWYVRLSRRDIVYLYTHESNYYLEQTFPIDVRPSMRNS